MSNTNQPNPKPDTATFDDTIRFHFVDPVGGVPLDDPEVLERERKLEQARGTDGEHPSEKPSSGDES